jgi:hypothetical protein
MTKLIEEYEEAFAERRAEIDAIRAKTGKEHLDADTLLSIERRRTQKQNALLSQMSSAELQYVYDRYINRPGGIAGIGRLAFERRWLSGGAPMNSASPADELSAAAS